MLMRCLLRLGCSCRAHLSSKRRFRSQMIVLARLMRFLDPDRNFRSSARECLPHRPGGSPKPSRLAPSDRDMLVSWSWDIAHDAVVGTASAGAAGTGAVTAHICGEVQPFSSIR